MNALAPLDGNESGFELDDSQRDLHNERVQRNGAPDESFGSHHVQNSTAGLVLSAEAVDGLAEKLVRFVHNVSPSVAGSGAVTSDADKSTVGDATDVRSPLGTSVAPSGGDSA